MSILNKLYLVKYYGGSYDDYYSVIVFATNNKSTAKSYVKKFNSILKKWKGYYKQFETKENGYSWIKDEFIDQHFHRWNQINNITKCYYDEIEVR